MMLSAATFACGDSETAGQGGSGATGAAGGSGGSGASGGSGGAGGGGGEGDAPDWSCLGSVAAPTYMAGSTFTVNYMVTELVDMSPLAGLTFDICDKATDPTCMTPIVSGTTANDGTVTLIVPGDGPLVGKATGTDIPDHYGYSLGVPETDPVDFPFTPISTANLALFSGLAGATLDPARGTIGTAVSDCVGMPAPGVTVSVSSADASTVYSYIDASGLPSDTLTETSSAATIGIFNVPPGPFTITYTVEATGDQVTTRSGEVFADSVTYPFGGNPTPEN